MNPNEERDMRNSRFNVTKSNAANYAREKKEIAKEALKRNGNKTRGPGSGLKGKGFGTN